MTFGKGGNTFLFPREDENPGLVEMERTFLFLLGMVGALTTLGAFSVKNLM
jgi:hypothetical protein